MKKRIRNKKGKAFSASKREPKRTYRDSLFRTIFGGKDERSKRWLLSLTDKHNKNLYGSVLVKIPSPQFIVFYNGDTEQADVVEYKLSDAFIEAGEVTNLTEIPHRGGQNQSDCKVAAKFEWTATVININKNHNESLSKKCEPLYHYIEFVNQVKENLSKGMSRDDAVNEAVDFAIRGKFLEGFFKEKRMKIFDDIYTEFDQESYDETLRNDGRIEGIQIGVQQASIANAKNALTMGLSPEQASQITSLPLEQVIALKEEIECEAIAITK
jgi:hypothetical protein